MTKKTEQPLPSNQGPTEKQMYQLRRQAGLRGQSDFYLPKGKALINGENANHLTPDWPAKPVSKKAIKKGSRRARRLLSE